MSWAERLYQWARNPDVRPPIALEEGSRMLAEALRWALGVNPSRAAQKAALQVCQHLCREYEADRTVNKDHFRRVVRSFTALGFVYEARDHRVTTALEKAAKVDARRRGLASGARRAQAAKARQANLVRLVKACHARFPSWSHSHVCQRVADQEGEAGRLVSARTVRRHTVHIRW